MLHYVLAGVTLAGNEGGGSKTHVNGWLVAAILVLCALALYFGGKSGND